MLSTMTRTSLALAILAIAAVPAFAEGNGPISGGVTATGMLSSAAAMPDVGQGYRPNPAYSGSVVIGGLLPPVSNSEGEPQSANSLPPGFLNGTVAMQHRAALQRYWANQAANAQHVANVTQPPNG
jgi:hypothetical protein